MFAKRVIFSLSAIALLTGFLLKQDSAMAQVYELRIYKTNEGKLDNLHARFRDHTVDLFKKHGMESIGYWVPTESPDSANTLIYVLKHASRDAAKKSWADFQADPTWQKVAKESQVDGQILAARPESVYMDITDYSPDIKSGGEGDEAVFELRTYRCNEAKLKNLDARFRDHTMRIFARHGMESVAYWHPAEEPASTDTLIYIIKHQSADAAKESWAAFRADEEWQKVAEESQKDGKFLRERPESVYLKATDYSAIK